jgi:hypothetical protein
MNLSRTQLIDAITPAWVHARNQSEPEVKSVLEQLHISELQRAYDRLVASGKINPPQVDPRAQEIEAAKQQAREIQRQFLENEKKELLERQAANQLKIVTDALFRPSAIFPGKNLTDNQANREALAELMEATAGVENIPRNPIAWLKQILKDAPQLIKTLSWEDYVTPQERKQEEQEQLELDSQAFYDFCRSTEKCSACESNFNLVRSLLGSPLGEYALSTSVVQLPEGVVLITDDGQTHALVSANTIEVEKWRQERFELDQQNLKQMARRGDIAGLRQRAQRDRELQGQDQAQLHFQYSLLKSYGERREYSMPPLPDTWLGQPLDPAFLRKASPETLRAIMSKHGSVAMNARLHQLPNDFFNHWEQKLMRLEEQLGFRRADFTRPDELAQALNQNRN